MTPDEIHIAGLALSVRIGVTERERAQPQRLSVSLTLQPAGGFAGLDDQIDHAVNYSAVCAVVRRFAQDNPPRRLIETFAEEITAAVLQAFPACEAVDVELRKYILPDTDYVAVRLSRRRSP